MRGKGAPELQKSKKEAVATEGFLIADVWGPGLWNFAGGSLYEGLADLLHHDRVVALKRLVHILQTQPTVKIQLRATRKLGVLSWLASGIVLKLDVVQHAETCVLTCAGI